MSEMVERVARAIEDALSRRYSVDDAECAIAARAAIEAMWLPTETMLAAAMRNAKIDLLNPERAWASGYSAMIDAALHETPRGK